MTSSVRRETVQGERSPFAASYLHAIVYARRGWPVLPLFGVVDGRCECRNPKYHDPDDVFKFGKHPRTAHGLDDATTDEDRIRSWWDMWPSSNVGVATGHGLAVVDVDPRHGGEETLEALAATNPVMPRGPTVMTGSGGFHFYFTGSVRSGAHALGDGLDVKSQRAYVVAPPSTHGKGGNYAWQLYDIDVPTLPEWLTPADKPTRDGGLFAVGTPFGARYALAALRSEFEAAAARVDGQCRRNELYEAGLKLSRFVLSGDLDRAHVLTMLVAGGVRSGLSEEVAAAHVANGLAQGIENGRAP